MGLEVRMGAMLMIVGASASFDHSLCRYWLFLADCRKKQREYEEKGPGLQVIGNSAILSEAETRRRSPGLGVR